jgi:phosphate-selective porin OprO/OprP
MRDGNMRRHAGKEKQEVQPANRKNPIHYFFSKDGKISLAFPVQPSMFTPAFVLLFHMNTRNTTTHKTKLAFLFAAAAVAGAASLPAQDATSAPASPVETRLQQLEQEIQQLKILNRQQELKAEKAEADAKKAPSVSFDAKGFNVATADKAFTLKIGGLVQADFRSFLDDGPEVADHRDTFLLRRVRLPVSVTAGKYFNFYLQPEFANADKADANTQLVDAWAELRPSPAFGIKAGKYPGPVSLETPNNRHFNEAPFTNQLATNRDLGIEIGGSLFDKIFTYRLGLYNGTPNGSWAETANLNDGNFTVGGRLTVAPFVENESKYLKGLAFSVGGSYGDEAASSNNGRIRTSGQQALFATSAYAGDHIRVSPAIEWYGGPASLVGEVIWERWDLHQGGTVDNYAWRVSGGWVLTGEDSTNKGVTPESSFDWGRGNWGAFEIVARVGGVKVDKDVRAKVDAFNYGIGVNWYLSRNLQFRVDLEKTDFGKGANIAKDEVILFGRLQLQF